jgi:hypothetical protein
MQRRTIFPKPVSTSGFHELGATKSFSNLCGEAAKPSTGKAACSTVR